MNKKGQQRALKELQIRITSACAFDKTSYLYLAPSELAS